MRKSERLLYALQSSDNAVDDNFVGEIFIFNTNIVYKFYPLFPKRILYKKSVWNLMVLCEAKVKTQKRDCAAVIVFMFQKKVFRKIHEPCMANIMSSSLGDQLWIVYKVSGKSLRRVLKHHDYKVTFPHNV